MAVAAPSLAPRVSCATVTEPLVQPAAQAADEQSMLAAATAGDPDAHAAIYRRFAGVVHGISLAHVGPQDAEDVTQEVFVAVYRRLLSLRESGSMGAWICRVARNTAIDHLRRRQRRPTHEPLGEVASSGLAGGDGGDVTQAVLACVQELPVAYRETLILRLVEGLAGPEIADRTGMTHGSVRVNLCRGMAMLRPLLEKEDLP